jgi:ABC-type dipeptide/oligopeptide/nickel transport system ATPase component
MVFVTHNLPLVRSIAQRVAVLAEGSIVEYGDTAEMLANPQQEYTRHLISDTPSLETAVSEAHENVEQTDGTPDRPAGPPAPEPTA